LKCKLLILSSCYYNIRLLF